MLSATHLHLCVPTDHCGCMGTHLHLCVPTDHCGCMGFIGQQRFLLWPSITHNGAPRIMVAILLECGLSMRSLTNNGANLNLAGLALGPDAASTNVVQEDVFLTLSSTKKVRCVVMII